MYLDLLQIRSKKDQFLTEPQTKVGSFIPTTSFQYTSNELIERSNNRIIGGVKFINFRLSSESNLRAKDQWPSAKYSATSVHSRQASESGTCVRRVRHTAKTEIYSIYPGLSLCDNYACFVHWSKCAVLSIGLNNGSRLIIWPKPILNTLLLR